MIQLRGMNNEKLSEGIRSLSPLKYESIKIKNKLFDGSYHIQTIGNPLKYFEFEILSNHEQVDILNSAEATGVELKLIIDGKEYTGYIDEEISWDRQSMRFSEPRHRLYVGKIKFVVNGEGDV